MINIATRIGGFITRLTSAAPQPSPCTPIIEEMEAATDRLAATSREVSTAIRESRNPLGEMAENARAGRVKPRTRGKRSTR